MPNCDKYRALILKLAKCPQLPQQARDALKQSFEQASAAWANIPASSQPAIDDACKQGLAAMQQGLSSYCP